MKVSKPSPNPTGTDKDKAWEVYIIQAVSGKLYTGITNNLERRFSNHMQSGGARFFHFSSPEKVVYRESRPNRSEASKREIAIKRMSRKEKLELILASTGQA
jgi:putative endonuclease